MKQKQKNILLIAGMLLVLLVGILAYSAYTQTVSYTHLDVYKRQVLQ